MATPPTLTPVEYLKQISPDAADAFQALRKAALSAGPLDEHTCELIVLSAFVMTGGEASFKVHARRLLKNGMDAAALRHAVLVTFAATTTFAQVSAALHWIDDVTA